MAFDYVEIAEEGRFLPWGRVAAEKVDEMEHWIANANAMVVVGNTAGHSADKTYDEIVTAIEAGRTVILKIGDVYYDMIGYDNYGVQFGKVSSANPKRWLNKFDLAKSGNYLSSESCHFLPVVGSLNNGSELVVSEGVWIAQQKKFVVTLTPDSLDYTGTMDKTVEEIYNAYNQGKDIVFKVNALGMEIEAPISDVNYHSEYTYPSFGGVIYDTLDDYMIYVYTGYTDTASKDTYLTVLYRLTRESSGD